MNNLKAIRILMFDVSQDTFQLVSSISIANLTWDRLMELCSRDVEFTHSIQTTLLSEFGSFEQKFDETINKNY